MLTLEEKKCPAIKTIHVDTATFTEKPATITPSVINFFYGENGTGKSTIARSIGSPDHLEWVDGITPDDYDILIYNRDFVADEFSIYNHAPASDEDAGHKDLRGIYTICKGNKEKEDQIAVLKEKQADVIRRLKDAKAAHEKAKKDKDDLLPALKHEIWDKSKTQYQKFRAANLKIGKSEPFYRKMSDKNLTAFAHDPDELEATLQTAFAKEQTRYDELSEAAEKIPAAIEERLPMLSKIITSSSETPFAQFLKSLEATDWLKTAHDRFSQHTHGKCPYCQQPLPENFEAQLASVFDEQYQESTRQLSLLQTAYLTFTKTVMETLVSNQQKQVSSTHRAEYDQQLETLHDKIEINQQRLAEKLKSPAQPIELHPILPIIQALNRIIKAINQEVRAHNAIIDDQKNQQKKCQQQILEYLKSCVVDELDAYRKNLKAAEKNFKTTEADLQKIQDENAAIESEIASLSKEIVSTVDAMNQINDTLRSTGFQGFLLRESPDYPNHYEIVRADGSIAENLSEGELQFIAFLYFYHQVRGNREDGLQKKKIVVIDDPVSSMDDGVLFIVGSLIREMLHVCQGTTDYHNPQDWGTYIKQIFILTHNIRFHTEITDQMVQDFTATNFYKVLKDGNRSSVHLCIKVDPAILNSFINYNPVQNSYQALWTQLQEATSTISVIHAIRQILDAYFIQMCSYDRNNLCTEVLKKHRDKFEGPAPEGGLPDLTKYHRAEALLRYISAPDSFGQHYVDNANDAQPYLEAFHLIFTAMNQEQHYQKMMETSRSVCIPQETPAI